MTQKESFFNHITEGYTTKGDFITIGAGMLNRETVTNALVKIPLKRWILRLGPGRRGP